MVLTSQMVAFFFLLIETWVYLQTLAAVLLTNHLAVV